MLLLLTVRLEPGLAPLRRGEEGDLLRVRVGVRVRVRVRVGVGVRVQG